MLGHGKSPKPKNFVAYDIKNLAQDIYKLALHLNLKKFILVSHSFGTLVALEFLQTHEAMAGKAIFFSPNISVDKTKTARLSKIPISILVDFFGWQAYGKTSGKHIDYSNHRDIGDWDLALNYADIRNTNLRVYVYCLKHIYDSDYDSIWQKLDLPSLIVHGIDDGIIPTKHVKALQQNMKNSRLIILPDANHLFVLNDPTGTAKIIDGFAA